MQKIFCIGLPRTGTSSLVGFINQNSKYKINKFLYNETVKKQCMNSDFKLKDLNGFSGTADLVACAFYREFYYEFPNSKFIYVSRDINQWLKSCEKWFSENRIDKNDNLNRNYPTDSNWYSFFMSSVFGSYQYNENLFRERYIQHDENINRFFKYREKSILKFDLSISNIKKRKLIDEFLGINSRYEFKVSNQS